MREFTEEELAKFDGKEGRPAYVAYRGRVYDVSSSFLWKMGKHQAYHAAGCDLTAALGDAPHGPEVLERFPVVGTMVRPP